VTNGDTRAQVLPDTSEQQLQYPLTDMAWDEARTGNCQVAVTCYYAERTLAWPVDPRRYRPKRWAEDRGLRRAAHIPEGVRFETKPPRALALLDEARTRALRWTRATATAGGMLAG
jgi:SRSO17 transposase